MGKPWFRTKAYGYGAGLPIRWEGWAFLAAVFAALIGVEFLPAGLTAPHPWLHQALRLGVILGAVFVAWFKTDAPWRWRWGGK